MIESKIIAKDSMTVRVRKEHIDIYEHLNNSCYAFYFERARKSILEKAGLDDREFKEKGIGLFVTTSHYKYQEQVNGGEDVKIDSEARIYKARIIVNSMMCDQRKEKASVETEHFFVDLKTSKPIKIPKDVLEKLVGD